MGWFQRYLHTNIHTNIHASPKLCAAVASAPRSQHDAHARLFPLAIFFGLPRLLFMMMLQLSVHTHSRCYTDFYSFLSFGAFSHHSFYCTSLEVNYIFAFCPKRRDEDGEEEEVSE